MVSTFDSNRSTRIISCYSPNNARDETDLDVFYNELTSVGRSIPKHNVLIIGGNMNAQIGKKVNNNISLHNLSKRNEEHLTDFTLENGLTYLIVNFK